MIILDKKIVFILPKHRFWVPVRTSTAYPSMFKSKNKKKRNTPVNPSFTIYKWGITGYKSHGHVILMSAIYNMEILVGRLALVYSCQKM